MKRTIYVIGFAFAPALNAVALIKKSNPSDAQGNPRPSWIAGKYNGIGTDITDENEKPVDAMVRTFLQRTNVATDQSQWTEFFQIHNHEAIACFYMATLNSDQWLALNSATSEVVHKVLLQQLRAVPVVDNLHWLIPMAIDKSFNFGMGYDSRVDAITNDQPVLMMRHIDDEVSTAKEWEKFKSDYSHHLQAIEEGATADQYIAPGVKLGKAEEIQLPVHPFMSMKMDGAKFVSALAQLNELPEPLPSPLLLCIDWHTDNNLGVIVDLVRQMDLRPTATEEEQRSHVLSHFADISEEAKMVLLLVEGIFENEGRVKAVAEALTAAKSEIGTLISDCLDTLHSVGANDDGWKSVVGQINMQLQSWKENPVQKEVGPGSGNEKNSFNPQPGEKIVVPGSENNSSDQASQTGPGEEAQPAADQAQQQPGQQASEQGQDTNQKPGEPSAESAQ